MHSRTIGAIAALVISTGAAVAQDEAPPPPCQDEVYRAFDFWLGEWEVFGRTPEGKEVKSGDNSITVEENGCLIVERWTDVQGGTGQSYNFYDPGMKKWRQVWVSGFGTIDYAGGLNEDGEMVLEGDISYRGGSTEKFKGIWTLRDDETVRQHFEQFDAAKEEWVGWYTGIYKRKPVDAE